MQPINIPVIRDADYFPSDAVELEIDAVLQPGRHLIQPPQRLRTGFGFDSSASSGFGFAQGLPFGAGVFGGGYLGQGAERITIQTTRDFREDDYTVRARSRDQIGNVSDWSASLDIRHDYSPPAPRNLALSSSGVLTGEWSDP